MIWSASQHEHMHGWLVWERGEGSKAQLLQAYNKMVNLCKVCGGVGNLPNVLSLTSSRPGFNRLPVSLILP